MDAAELASQYWREIGWPLSRLLLGLGFGLALGIFLELSGLTARLAVLTRPICGAAHLGPSASSAFAVAFASPQASNSLLAESFTEGRLGWRELLCANLLCGLPTFFVHTPTVFFLTFPVLGGAALGYVGVSLLAALIRAGIVIVCGRFWLPLPVNQPNLKLERPRAADAFAKGCRRFCRRLPRLFIFTIPVYLLFYWAMKSGLFGRLQSWLGNYLAELDFISPEAMGIVVLQMAAETGATLGAAGALLNDGVLSPKDVVLAMLVGNILATPFRALRHQLPAYAGYYRMRIAIRLVSISQCFRALSMLAMIWLFAAFWPG